MPKIKWIRMIDSNKIKDYQIGDLAKNAIKLNTPKEMKGMMIKSIPFMIIGFLICFVSGYFRSPNVYLYRKFIFIGILIGVLLTIVHELLHAIVYPKGATVYIGILKNLLGAFALASYSMKKSRFILMCLLPYILGIFPLILFWVIPIKNNPSIMHSILYGITMVGLLSPAPDMYNVYQILKKTPKDCEIQFYEDDMYYIEK